MVASWVVVFGAIPVAVARRGRRFGWKSEKPGAWNRAGLLSVGVGAAGLGYCLRAHYSPGDTAALSLVPEKLLASGPYTVSRNPMYVSEQTILLGWALYFGSPRLVGGMAVLGAAMRYAVLREEKTLESRFGDAWRDYAARVPRWI